MKKTTIFLLSMFFAVDFFAVGAFASFEFREVDIHGFISQGYLHGGGGRIVAIFQPGSRNPRACL